jgi:hypothetical protein
MSSQGRPAETPIVTLSGVCRPGRCKTEALRAHTHQCGPRSASEFVLASPNISIPDPERAIMRTCPGSSLLVIIL